MVTGLDIKMDFEEAWCKCGQNPSGFHQAPKTPDAYDVLKWTAKSVKVRNDLNS